MTLPVRMTLPVLTAVADPRWEAELVGKLTAPGSGVEVARRCVDLADLLATAAAGLGRAALVAADVRRLDRDALTRLAVAGTAVVGLVAPDDEPGERRLRQLGVTRVARLDASAEDLVAAVVAAVEERGSGPGFDLAGAARTGVSAADRSAANDDGSAGRVERSAEPGMVIAVWGPTGAPGRTTTAVNLAAETAALGRATMLVDADGYGGVVAAMLGLLDEAPGLAAACRLANNGSLDVAALAELAPSIRGDLRVLTGITRAERWPELRAAAVDTVLTLARQLAAVVVVDCGFCLEQDEELVYDTAAPRRHGATLATLAAADVVLGVATADPIGLTRYVRGLAELADAVPDARPRTVVNRVRKGPVGPGDPHAEIAAALRRYAGVTDPRFVPLDVVAMDTALAAGRTLAEAAPGSAARQAFRAIGAELVGAPAPNRRNGLRRAQRGAR